MLYPGPSIQEHILIYNSVVPKDDSDLGAGPREIYVGSQRLEGRFWFGKLLTTTTKVEAAA
jgi:hypothetical protein